MIKPQATTDDLRSVLAFIARFDELYRTGQGIDRATWRLERKNVEGAVDRLRKAIG